MRKRPSHRLVQWIACCAIAALPFVVQAGTAAGKSTAAAVEEEPPEFNNWITLGIGGVSLTGDSAQFQQRRWINNGVFGGIEDLHYERALGEKVTLKLDGRVMPGLEDYYGSVELVFTDFGYIKAGYHGFRTWYDGHGGFFPFNQRFFELYDNEFSIDRADIWVELGLRVPNWPELTFRYERQTREGRKDSTIWGDSNLTGRPAPNIARGIVPTFLDIDDSRDVFKFDLRHTVGKVEIGAGFRYETQSNENSRNIRRRPDEITADRFLTHRETWESDMWSAHFHQTTRLNDKLQFSAAYMYTRLDADIGGSRIYGISYDPVFDPVFARRQLRDEGFLDLMGESHLDQHVTTLNLAWRPIKDLTIIPAFRFEWNDLATDAHFVETNVLVNPPPAGFLRALREDVETLGERHFFAANESLEIRYGGIKNWLFYARGEWMQEDLTQRERRIDHLGRILIGRDSDGDIWMSKYTIGANWYATPALTLAAQYYSKDHINDYRHPFDTTNNRPPSQDRYPAIMAEQDFHVDDVNIRVTWRPSAKLTWVSRYDYQRARIDSQVEFLRRIETADIVAHIYSQTITWTPFERLYIQTSATYVQNETDTPADQQVGALVLDARNDYFNGNFAVGFAIDDKTNLRVNYFYYHADNFRDNSLVSMPYGAQSDEHAITALLSRDFTQNVRGSLKYGFFNNCSDATGGRHNYDAHLFAGTLQYRF